MSWKFDNYNSIDLINKKPKKVILKSLTPLGFIQIEKLPKMIIATDQDGQEVARTYSVNENGLKWLKKECRGWGGWQRLKWNIESKKQLTQPTEAHRQSAKQS